MTKDYLFVVVDDDPTVVELITMLLQSGGHRVVGENSGADALATIKKQKPDCVLADIMMPDKGGFELCAEIRGDAALAATRVIMVSAKTYEHDRKRAKGLGADGFITKPVEAASFLGDVERILADDIFVSFWGVRGTLPVPGKHTLRYGGNTSCVTMEFGRGQFFIFDGGSGIKVLSDHLMGKGPARIDAKIFISHPHWDHINALPFFVPLYLAGNEFEILGATHGETTTRELISAQMDGIYFPITINEFGARVYFRDLSEESLEIDAIRVRTMLLSHPGNCLGYRVEYGGRAICYVTDNELFLEGDPSHNPEYVRKLIDFVSGCDCLITDSTYTDEEYKSKVGWGHSAISQVVDLADRAGVETLYLFHHDPDQTDEDIDAKLQTAEDLLEARGSKTRCVAPAEGSRITIATDAKVF